MKLLSRFSFMIIVRSFDEQQRILGTSPLYMDVQMVVALPWEAIASSYKVTRNSYLVWVDLLSMNPIMEIYANSMLKQVGKFISSSTLAILSRFAHIKGCVLVELDKPIIDAVEADILEVGMIHIDVTYKMLPFIFAYYKISGHLDKQCKTKCKQTRLKIDR